MKWTIYEIVLCLRSKVDDMKMSRQCFAEMPIHFHFGKFLALPEGSILGKVMPKFSMTTEMVLISSCLYRAGDNGHHE